MTHLTISADAHARLTMLDEMHRRGSTSASTANVSVAGGHEPLLDLAGAMVRYGSTSVADWFDADEGI